MTFRTHFQGGNGDLSVHQSKVYLDKNSVINLIIPCARVGYELIDSKDKNRTCKIFKGNLDWEAYNRVS